MRIAVISDIHGNLPAFEAVAADIARRDVHEVLVCGDLVGRGPQGHGVTERIRALGWRSLRGNHEDYLLNFRRGKIPPAWRDAPEWNFTRWMADELTDEDEAYLEQLPLTLVSDQDTRLRLWHGSPRGYCDGIGAWTTDDELAEILALVSEPVLVCAHTHRPFEVERAQKRVVNIGSVGLPFNGDWWAQYAVFHCAADTIEVEFIRVAYDRAAFLAIYQSSGFLALGGVAARLLYREVETARPHLVPYQKWCRVRSLPQDACTCARFLAAYDPSWSMKRFAELMEECEMKLQLEIE